MRVRRCLVWCSYLKWHPLIQSSFIFLKYGSWFASRISRFFFSSILVLSLMRLTTLYGWYELLLSSSLLCTSTSFSFFLFAWMSIMIWIIETSNIIISLMRWLRNVMCHCIGRARNKYPICHSQPASSFWNGNFSPYTKVYSISSYYIRLIFIRISDVWKLWL